MTTLDPQGSAPGSDDERWLEQIFEQFEDRWEAGPRPEIDAYLPADGPGRRAALVELVHVDLERRLKAGDAARVEDYLRRYPELSEDWDVVLKLIAAECEFRRRREPDRMRDEYLRRFPQYREQLIEAPLLASPSGDEGTISWIAAPAGGSPPSSGSAVPDSASAAPIPADRVVSASTVAPLANGPPPPSPVPGAPDIAGYEILDELGRGGMGVVYLARQVKLKRLVALKMILPGSGARREALGRFRREAEAVARLEHPNIVQIHEVGEHGSRPFFSLEYATGGSLARKLAGTPQPPAVAAGMVQTLARAMHAAHEKGIVHRDLKPANVLLMADGTPKISDFGLAKLLDQAERISRSGEIIGTPSYMAPEQAAGKTREIGHRADVYALGAILYKMLTGRPPFKAATELATLALVRDEEPVPPRHLNPKLPRDLETICLKCLEKDPRRRYASAAALAEDLRLFLADEPIAARPVGALARALKWARRRPTAAALVAVLALSAVGLVAGAFLYQRQRAQIAEQKYQRIQEDQQRLGGQRADVQALLIKGQEAYVGGNWREAKLHFNAALVKSGTELRLADLRAQVMHLLDQADRRLAEQERRERDEEARREARRRFEAFQDLRDEALFRQTFFTGHDPAEDRLAMAAAAREALALFEVRDESAAPLALHVAHLDAAEADEMTRGCYEMLLVLVEAVAHVEPDPPSERLRDQVEQALRILDRAEAIGPDTRAFHQRRARLLARLGDEMGARRERQRAEALQPSTATDFYLLGVEASRANDLKQAQLSFREVLSRQPDHFWAQYGLATCHLRLRQWAATEASLTACIGRRPTFGWLYPLRALARAELGEFAAAEDDFRKAEGLPLDKSARYALLADRGAVRLQQEQYAAAEADLKAAIALRPTLFQAHHTLAKVYLKQGQHAAALEHLDQAIRHETSQAFLFRDRAGVHLLREDATAALGDLDRALQLDPLSREAAEDHSMRGRILQAQGHRVEAVQAYDAALALRPDAAQVYRWKAEALTEQADAEPAPTRGLQQQIVRALDSYLETGPPTAEVFRARGQARSKLSDFAGALLDYGRALELEPDAATLTARGWTYQLAFDASALALPDFEAALGLDARNADAYNGRGFARVRIGPDVRAAVADAEEAVRLDPEGPHTLVNAARTHAQAVGRFDARTVARPAAGPARPLPGPRRAVAPPGRRQNPRRPARRVLAEHRARCRARPDPTKPRLPPTDRGERRGDSMRLDRPGHQRVAVRRAVTTHGRASVRTGRSPITSGVSPIPWPRRPGSG